MATITTRAQLMDALRLACELEHGLMCQYLFAAYSLKRYPYERFQLPSKPGGKPKAILTPAQLEEVRRWAMKITLIARQEMEHLGLALNLLSSIGGTPSFSRPNMPQRLDYYGEAKIKLELTTCDLATIQRFEEFERPDNLEAWCKEHGCPGSGEECDDCWCDQQSRGASREEVYAAISAPRPGLLQGAPHVDLYGIPYKNVQELYETIDGGFTALSASLGESQLFVGNPGNQIFGGPPSPLNGSMNDLNQYGLSLIAVTGLSSARQAIRMIIEQGEGARVPPNYLPHTHFCLFRSIRKAMQAGTLGKLGARNVARNPMTRIQPDVTQPDEVSLIRDADTLAVAELFNQCYEVMLLLLLYLYSDQVKTAEQTNALMDAAFFPFMTMFVRPMAEILTELPGGFTEKESAGKMAGPGFELPGDVVLFPNLDATWTLFQERIDALVLGFRKLTARRALPPPPEFAAAGPEPVRPKWGWVPVRDPWAALPSQQVDKIPDVATEYPELQTLIDERARLWARVKDEAITIRAEELEHAKVVEPTDGEVPPSLPWLRLYYLRQNIERLQVDWSSNWLNVGRTEDNA